MKSCMILIYFIMMVIMGYASEKDENTKKEEWEANYKSFEKNKIDEEPSRNVITKVLTNIYAKAQDNLKVRMENIAPAKITAMNGRITTIKKHLMHHNLMTYLTLQDAFKFGITCKLLFRDMITKVDGAAEERKYRITKICYIHIPENIFPHVTFLFKLNFETSSFLLSCFL